MGSAVLGVLGSEAKALSVLWLQELVDDEERAIRIPVLKSKNLKQLRQNVRRSPHSNQSPSTDHRLATSSAVHQRLHQADARLRDCEASLTFNCWFSKSLTRTLCLFLQVGWLTTKYVGFFVSPRSCLTDILLVLQGEIGRWTRRGPRERFRQRTCRISSPTTCP